MIGISEIAELLIVLGVILVLVSLIKQTFAPPDQLRSVGVLFIILGIILYVLSLVL